MQKFFTNTIESGFIKDLLYKTPIPVIPTRKAGDYVVKSFFYVYEYCIIECTGSGFLGSNASYDIIDEFETQKSVLNLTEKYISKYTYYDSFTHEMLGNYLRVLRDILGVDLFPYYNCFSYRQVHGICMTYNSSNYSLENVGTRQVKLAVAPIRFNTKNTVCIDCHSEVLIYPLFYDDSGVTTDKKLISWCCDNVIRESGMSFTRPRVFEFSNINQQYNSGVEDKPLSEEILENSQKNLYMVIQIPPSNESSILIQEGDYTRLPRINSKDNSFSLVYNTDNIDKWTPTDLNSTFRSPISLQTMNTGESYAFSDRLIEYLLWNVITNLDEVGDNIAYVQKNTIKSGEEYWKGIWDNGLRSKVYSNFVKSVTENKNTKSQFRDVCGFVDKDTEWLLNK